MHIVKVAKNVYEVRRHRYPRPMFRGTMSQCVEFMRANTVETHYE